MFAEEEAGLFEELFSLKHQNITFNEICIHIVHSNDDQINAQMLNPLYTDNTSVANASTNIGKASETPDSNESNIASPKKNKNWKVISQSNDVNNSTTKNDNCFKYSEEDLKEYLIIHLSDGLTYKYSTEIQRQERQHMLNLVWMI